MTVKRAIWECVNSASYGSDNLYRIKVPGGWIYRYFTYDDPHPFADKKIPLLSLVYVPDPKKFGN
jgi:hypothetical protein